MSSAHKTKSDHGRVQFPKKTILVRNEENTFKAASVSIGNASSRPLFIVDADY
jgi:hypothetical protein